MLMISTTMTMLLLMLTMTMLLMLMMMMAAVVAVLSASMKAGNRHGYLSGEPLTSEKQTKRKTTGQGSHVFSSRANCTHIPSVRCPDPTYRSDEVEEKVLV